MTRRALSPAARGVSIAVLAALRAGRVDLADQADGSTLATSTAPDGTVLLRAVLRLPVPGADPRQLTLGAVSLTPQPAEVPPAPVAVPADPLARRGLLCDVLQRLTEEVALSLAAWGQDPDSALRTEATIDSLLARALLIRGRA